MRNAYKILFEKPGRRRQLSRPSSRWVDIIGIYLEKILDKNLDCIHMAHDQVYCQMLADTVMSLRLRVS
jgi:hypothetical protein